MTVITLPHTQPGQVRATPVKNNTALGFVELPSPLQVPAVGSIDLEPTNEKWCWKLETIIYGVATTTEYVVVAKTDEDYTQLIRVDAGSFTSSHYNPEPAWWAALRAGLKSATPGQDGEDGEDGKDGEDGFSNTEAEYLIQRANGAATRAASHAENTEAIAGNIRENIVAETDKAVTRANIPNVVAVQIGKAETVVAAAAAAVNANPKISEIEANQWRKPAMPDAADFNDYTTPGDIPVPTGAGKTNAPSTLGGNLQVRSGGGTIILHEYITNETAPKTLRRRRSAGSWGVWGDESERSMGGRGALPASTDLNSLNQTTHNGDWALTGPNWNSYLNLPPNIAGGRGTLEIIAPNNWTVTHRITPSAGTKRYERILTSPTPATFGPWQTIDTAEHPSDDWIHWGDSLTDAAALGVNSWVTKLAALTGKNHINEGWYGQLAAQIAARQGGNPSLMTIDGGQIPAAGTPVKVTTTTTHISMPVGEQQPSRQVPGTLAGRSGYLYDGGANTTDGFFMPTSGTAATPATSTQRFTPTANADIGRNRIMTICIGENDIWSTGPSPQHVAYMARQMHDYQNTNTKRVLVLSIPDRAGNATAPKVNAINAALKAEFPNQFIDVAGYLRSEKAATDAGITYTNEDKTDIAGGFTPRVFRLPTDSVHYNALACSIIAPYIHNAARERGWL